MPKINIDQLCKDFEACVGWPYKSPGTNDERGIDCSGMFVRAYKLQGASIYHGSNTIWRRHLGNKGKIVGTGDLKRGMAVFKWKPEDTPKHPDGQGNFCHIGLVVSVYPLRIIHASTVGMKVTVDTKIGKWRYWGYLLEGDYGSSIVASQTAPSTVLTAVPVADPPPPGKSLIYPFAMGQPTLRRGHRGDDVARMQQQLVRNGFPVQVDGIFGKETLSAVRAFQRSRNIAVDGVVGKNTWAQLGAL